MKYPLEPFKIKVVERIRHTTREEREEIIKEAGYNVFNIPAEKIHIDLLTDSGTSAMSDNQWSGMMLGDESYAGSRNFYNFRDTVKDIFGYQHVIPTHQGRVAENLLFSTIGGPGTYIPNNIHFDTTRANVQSNHSIALDLVIDEAYDPECDHPFKGNMDLDKLEKLVQRVGPDNIPVVMLTITNNSGGGQPVSMQNIRETSELTHRHGLKLVFDACRFAENAYFIKQREAAYADKTILAIAQEMFSYGDGATMSAKKDALVNIGGFLTLNDSALTRQVTNKLIMIEGFPTYGGLAGRDLEAVARGLREVLEEEYLEFRVEQVAYLARCLTEAGVPILKPVGGHAVYLNARGILPHIPSEQFPGQALTVELYLEGGIRGVEIGSLMFAQKDQETGKMTYPELEMVRLAIPRRVYTTGHMRYVAEAIIRIYQRRGEIKGMEILEAPEVLRHFTARMKPLD
ncbi:MAG: tryptophanase [Candidatus Delongbacteria bacterium]|nr:tryptophanase [Candidatus Delongbacteria bacterium]